MYLYILISIALVTTAFAENVTANTNAFAEPCNITSNTSTCFQNVTTNCKAMNSVSEFGYQQANPPNSTEQAKYNEIMSRCVYILRDSPNVPTFRKDVITASITYIYCSYHYLNLETFSNLTQEYQTYVYSARKMCMDSMKALCNNQPNEILEIQTICLDNRDNACAINNMLDHNNSALLFCGADTDGDGVGDYWDAFPNDPSETTDTDNDGIGDNTDTFPEDNNATIAAVFKASELLLRTVFNQKYSCDL